MSTPDKSSTPAGLSAAQALYYNQLASVNPTNAAENLDYVKSLNDIQSLASLAATTGRYSELTQGPVSADQQFSELQEMFFPPPAPTLTPTSSFTAPLTSSGLPLTSTFTPAATVTASPNTSTLQGQVDQWFADNPNATGQQVVDAIQGVGGLDANPGLTDILAVRYGVAPNEVQNYYSTYSTPSSAPTFTSTATVTADPAPLSNLSITGQPPAGLGALGAAAQDSIQMNPEDAAQNKLIQDLYTEYLGSGRVAEQEGLDYWKNQFGPEIDANEREQFRQAAAAELTKNFGEGDAGLLGGFKYAKDLGVTDAGLRSVLGDDLYNQYQGQLQNFATTNINNIVADNSLTFDESQKVAKFARDLRFDSQQLADLTGKDKSLFDTILTSYDTNRNKIINDTLAGPNIKDETDQILAAISLERQFGFNDNDFAQATGLDLDVVKGFLDPVRNFETDFSAIANDTDTTTQQLKDQIAEAKANPAINRLYGESLAETENKIAELEQKWSKYGSDPIQSENLFQQLNAQKEALGGQYFRGVFSDLENSAAQLVKKGLDTMSDLGQKDKFQTTQATRAQYTDGEKWGNWATEGDGENSYSVFVPLTAEEQATLNEDGTYQKKLGTVVIDKDTGQELTGLDGNLLYQRSGGRLTSKKHYLTANFTDEGVPYLTASEEKSGIYGFVSDVGPMVISFAAMIPGPHQPFAMAANAALALEQKNYIGAVLSGLGAYGTYTGNQLAALKSAQTAGGFESAATAAQIQDLTSTAANIKLAQTAVAGFSALQQENLAGVINAGLSAYGQTGGTLPSGVTTALQAVSLASAIEADDIPAALTALGDLTGSKDLYVAASAKNLIDALESGNISNVLQAGMVFGNSFNAANQARQTVDTGGIQNLITDDMTEAGATAFADAKRAGADDDDALAAANAATGVVVNKIPDSESGNAVTTTYTRTPAAEAGVQRERLNEEYASSLGKTVDTLSKEEAENFSDKIESAIGSGGYAVLKGASIQDILSGNYASLPTDEKGFYYDEQGTPRVEIVGYNKLDSAGNVINMEPTETGSKIAANVADAIVENITGLDGTTGKIVQQGLSTLFGLVGEQVADLSTSLGNMGLISRDNAGVTAGKYLEDIGSRLQLPETKLALSNWVSGVEKEPTYWGKIASGVKGAWENPLVLTEVVKEIGQEVLPGALALKVAKYAGLAAGVASSTVLNALESAGSTGRQVYDEEIAKGTPPAEAAKIADRKAGYAGIITMATSGIVDAAIAKKYGAAIEDFLGKKASSTGGEFVQEGLEEGLIALATGKTPAEALTQSVVGSLVGAKTSGTIQTAADVQADLSASFASQGLASTDGSFRAETIVPIGSVPSASTGTAKDPADIGGATTGVEAAVGSPSAITVADAQSAAADLGLNVSDDVAVSLATKIQEATNSGNDVSVTSDANTVTISDATANTKTIVDANTGTTTVVDANNNTTTQTTVDANTNTQTTVTVDSNTNTTTQTNVNTNTNATTSTTVDTNNNTTTQTTFNPNTNIQTTVVTDTNTNTQTTVNVNTDTGELIDQKETPIPDGWKQPVIEPPVVPPTATTPTPATEAPKVPQLAPRLPGDPRTGAGGVGLPAGMTLNPASLRSRETQKAIDPLARVKEMQAEFERDAMIQNVDPRLMQILQQRSDPQQQSQQFDKDIGALAKLLSGKPDTPSSDAGNYYSYGSEDSIDDILGGKAANYKEGGFVEPLKASGGSMALPLMAKAGGALGSYKGREDFKDGKHVAGKGDGQSDDIPAWLADGEFVFPADVVSALGNGSTKAGTDKLYEMMHSIRDRARSKGPKDLPPPALKSPLDYLKSSKRSTA